MCRGQILILYCYSGTGLYLLVEICLILHQQTGMWASSSCQLAGKQQEEPKGTPHSQENGRALGNGKTLPPPSPNKKQPQTASADAEKEGSPLTLLLFEEVCQPFSLIIQFQLHDDCLAPLVRSCV